MNEPIFQIGSYFLQCYVRFLHAWPLSTYKIKISSFKIAAMPIEAFRKIDQFNCKLWEIHLIIPQYFYEVPQQIHNFLFKSANQIKLCQSNSILPFDWLILFWLAYFNRKLWSFLRNFSKILRNYQMNTSTLANEPINIFGNASTLLARWNL